MQATPQTRLLLIAGLALAAITTRAAWADPPQDAPVYAKRTVVDFSALSITGETSRPDASYVVVPKRARFRTLIRTRGDFLPEIERSVSAVR